MVETAPGLATLQPDKLLEALRELGVLAPSDPLPTAVSLLAMGVFLGLLAWLLRSREAPRAAIKSWRKGEAWFEGQVRPVDELVSPYLKKSCAYFGFVVWYPTGRKREPVVAHDQQASSRFVLEDKTGKVLVVPGKDATFALKPAFVTNLKPDEPDPGLLTRLGRAGVANVEDLVADHPRVHVEECLLPAGARVQVLGQLRDVRPEDGIDPAWGVQRILERPGEGVIVADPHAKQSLPGRVSWGALFLTYLAAVCVGVAFKLLL